MPSLSTFPRKPEDPNELPLPTPPYFPPPPEEEEIAPTTTMKPNTIPAPGVFNHDVLVDPQDGALWAFGATITYSWDYGLRFSPKAAKLRAKPCAVWRVHTGYALKVVSWAAQQIDRAPAVPHTDTGDPNDILLNKYNSSPIPGDMPDGGKLITIAGQYVYLMRVHPTETDLLKIPASPLRAVATNYIDPSLFSRYIIGPAMPVSGGGGPPVTF